MVKHRITQLHLDYLQALFLRMSRGPVFQKSGEAEQALAARPGLPRPARLLLVNEEAAVILTPDERAQTG